jgi:hypothetical protein
VLDEIPGAYKPIEGVMDDQRDLVGNGATGDPTHVGGGGKERKNDAAAARKS